MAIVNPWKLYFRREYNFNGEWEEQEGEAAMLPNGYSYPNDYYIEYRENNPIFGVGLLGNYLGKFAGYKPGLIYLPDNAFTYKDLFTDSDFEAMKTDLFDNIHNEAFLFHNSNSNHKSSERIIKLPRYHIFYKSKDNWNQVILPLGVIIATAFSGIRITKFNAAIYFGRYTFSPNVDIQSLESQCYYVGNSATYNLIANVNGVRKTLIMREDYYCNGYDDFGLRFSNSINASGYDQRFYTYDSATRRYDEWVENVKALKFYLTYNALYDITNDGIRYFRNNYNLETSIPFNINQPMNILWDLTNCPNYPTAGFYITSLQYRISQTEINNKEYYRGYPFWSRADFSQDANSTDPSHKQDPNDRDPGHGPGGSSDDKGGNGDHDNTSDKILPPGIPTLSGSGVGLFTIFNPNASQLAELGKKLWNPTALQAIKQYFSTPMETILGLGIIPVQPRQGSAKNILLGVYDTEISCMTVSSDYVIKDCGSISINRYYGSYLDYDPYTRINLYLPYIGEIQVDPDEVMQTVLGVEYHVNVVTGDCVAIVTSDGSIVYTAAGNCIRQLPIGQTDYSNIINTAVSAVSTIATAVAGGSAASNVGNAVAGAAKTEAGKQVAEARTSSQLAQEGFGAGSSLINQVMQSKMRYNHAGSIGVGSGQLSYQKPYLTIERPNLDLADNYKSFVGYPCNETMQLSHCSGFTQIESCKLSVSGATDGELTEILAFLTEGVII